MCSFRIPVHTYLSRWWVLHCLRSSATGGENSGHGKGTKSATARGLLGMLEKQTGKRIFGDNGGDIGCLVEIE